MNRRTIKYQQASPKIIVGFIATFSMTLNLMAGTVTEAPRPVGPKPLHGEIVQILDDGILVHPMPLVRKVKETVVETRNRTVTRGTALSGERRYNVPYTVNVVREVKKTVDSWYLKDEENTLIFLACDPTYMINGRISTAENVYMIGVYKYVTESGETKQIRAFKIYR